MQQTKFLPPVDNRQLLAESLKSREIFQNTFRQYILLRSVLNRHQTNG